ncbi:imidazole glycerol phosphate synthase subunit HisH [Kyrpidia spormannii]|uniref:Imidazole glycerol phosphate synthase, glutamine amidotransferase subunit n=2 Tax=Kyrpidia spormannii TaxID=2055160 RepID=A0ACA8Z621_9BACL|nr:imidazole glycerol phosphate synthase subunit HisH [Kyrpidia spormannii]CAB3389865.1 imidazole glycerol phosphate synthase, glutamine amidotransferase subunit [Kyrpidia spormannii]CAB3390764.1 imidazole glycerol phosphate synthase, glutamine amidotransferase subunit [Kyrpidia spormannii]HHY67728.1 imidazole glycerol phosphate synthase subunit HisH [Alicyclobacillus sp.]
MIAVIDYGMGNLHSVAKGFAKVGVEARVTSDPRAVVEADGVVLPGVGAFGDAMFNLRHLGMLDAIRRVVKEGRPLLGICLGMQLLFSESEEHGRHVGLHLIPGKVRRFQGDFKIPHMGWNDLTICRPDHPLVDGVKNGDFVYFVHSYYAEPQDPGVVVADTDYHVRVPAIVAKDQVMGMQFHPEKSSDIGLRMLRNFADLCGERVGQA